MEELRARPQMPWISYAPNTTKDSWYLFVDVSIFTYLRVK
jgi:hypothetical protein